VLFEGLGMKKVLALGVGVLALGGCALPVPIQVATWALDGLSYMVTDKSVTDHGISMVAQKDCALLRGLTDGSVCRDWDDAATLVADATGDGQPSRPAVQPASARVGYAAAAHSDIPPLSVQLDDGMPNVEALANFDTAAGPAEDTPAISPALRPSRALAAKPPAKPKAETLAISVAERQLPKVPPVTALAELPVPPQVVPTKVRLAAKTAREPVSGIYYVIGSFRNFANAEGLAERYEQLVPEVLAAKLDGAPVYRVVVGPVPQGRETQVLRQVALAGVRNSWAIRIVSGDWMLARRDLDRRRQMAANQELARLPR
jgi:hypothetical protein